jgi:hypothetical protein
MAGKRRRHTLQRFQAILDGGEHGVMIKPTRNNPT